MASCHTGKAGKSSCPVDTAFDATSLPSNTGTAVASVVLPLLDGNFTPKGLRFFTVETASNKRSKTLVLKTKGSSMHRIYIYIHVRYSHNRTDVFLWSSLMVNCLNGRLLLWKYIIIQLSELSCTVWRWLRWCLMCIYRYRYMEVRWKREILGDCLPFIQSCSVAPQKTPPLLKVQEPLKGRMADKRSCWFLSL